MELKERQKPQQHVVLITPPHALNGEKTEKYVCCCFDFDLQSKRKTAEQQVLNFAMCRVGKLHRVGGGVKPSSYFLPTRTNWSH